MVSPLSSDKNTEGFNSLKETLVKQIIQEFDSASVAPEDYNQVLIDLILRKFKTSKFQIPDEQRNILFHQIIDEVLGFGILQPLIDDPNITEILVNGKNSIFIKTNHQIVLSNSRFRSDEEITQTCIRICKHLGFDLNSENPVVDERLSDGSRMYIMLPPVAIESPVLLIQKFIPCKYTIADLLESGVFSDSIAEFLHACVASKLNILISGLEKSGKTSLLNCFSEFIPINERLLTLEETPELNFPHKQIIRLETKLPRLEKTNLPTPEEMIHLSINLHPDRIIVDELRGGECLALMQAMNTGINGSIYTIHASSPRDAVQRMATLCLMSGKNLPVNIINEQIASALDLIIQVSQIKDSSLKIIAITEISGMESEDIILTDIFRFKQSGIDPNGKILGTLVPNGIRPIFGSRLENNGYKLNPETFGANLFDLLNGKV